MAIEGYFVFLPLPNNGTNSRLLLTMLLSWWSCSPFQPCAGLQSSHWCPLTALWSCPWWWRQRLECRFCGQVSFIYIPRWY